MAGKLEYNGQNLDPRIWNLYPAQNGQLQFIDASGTETLKSIDANLYFNNELLAKASDIQDIADWSLYPALANVDMANHSIVNAAELTATSVSANGGVITNLTSNATTTGTLSSGTLTASTITANDVSANGISAETLNAVTAILTDVSAETISASSIRCSDISATTIRCLDICANIIKANTQIDVSNDVILTTSGTGNLLINGQPVATGNPVERWSTYRAVSDVDLSGNALGLSSTTTRINGNNVNINGANDINCNAVSDFNVMVDRGTNILNAANLRLEAQNGVYGNILMKAHGGNLVNGDGGLIVIEADSIVTPEGIAPFGRINMNAATLELQAGLVDMGSFVVPEAVNILNGAGAGIEVLASVGPINVAAGSVATVAGGANVVLSSGSGVIVDTTTVGGSLVKTHKIVAYAPPTTGENESLTLDGGAQGLYATSVNQITGGSAGATLQNIGSINGNTKFQGYGTTATVDISGSLQTTQILDVSGSAGAGKLLTSDASGHIRWGNWSTQPASTNIQLAGNNILSSSSIVLGSTAAGTNVGLLASNRKVLIADISFIEVSVPLDAVSLMDTANSLGTANQVLSAGPSGGELLWVAASSGPQTQFYTNTAASTFSTTLTTIQSNTFTTSYSGYILVNCSVYLTFGSPGGIASLNFLVNGSATPVFKSTVASSHDVTMSLVYRTAAKVAAGSQTIAVQGETSAGTASVSAIATAVWYTAE
ncbi:MAG: hypothetical protein EB117_14140 [Betaproteobacteria bacterium]|nr:hypothetical protein [Betaproteobacteria bacterium]